MTRAKRPARRGEVGLVKSRSGTWGIRWGRSLARELGLSLVESTQTSDRSEAERILRTREIQVAKTRGDADRLDALYRAAPVTGLDAVITDFLRAFTAGELPGPTPRPNTVENYGMLLLGKRGGLLTFARATQRTTTDKLDGVLVERWLESERGRAAPDTLRLKLIAARRLIKFAADRGMIPPERAASVGEIRPPAATRGRARRDGVPSEVEIKALLGALSPRYWRPIAELQLRLGLRRAEVLAMRADWIDTVQGAVNVRPGDGFDTKNHTARTVDGVDPQTLALARQVVAIKAERGITKSGYVEAWKRACAYLARRGRPWLYRSKSHGLRSAYATASRMAGVPLSVVRDRMGHESERTTERHYIGRTNEKIPGPFEGKPLISKPPATVAQAVPLQRGNIMPANDATAIPLQPQSAGAGASVASPKRASNPPAKG